MLRSLTPFDSDEARHTRLREFDALILAWRDRRSLRSANTGKTYLSRLKQAWPDLLDAVEAGGGHLGATAIGPLVQRWRDRGWSEATVNLTLEACKAFWGDMADAGHLPATNPFADLKPARAPSLRGERVLTHEEYQRLLDCAPSLEGRLLMEWLYWTACRISAAVSATWGSVRRDDDGERYWDVVEKGRKARTLWIPGHLWTAVQDLPGRHAASDRLWPHHRQWAWALMQRAKREAGLTDRIVSPHVLRHTHATLALQNGADIMQVKEQLGHSRLETTAVYIAIRPGPRSAAYLEDV